VAEDDDQDRRHQRAAAHAGQANQRAHAETEDDDQRVHSPYASACPSIKASTFSAAPAAVSIAVSITSAGLPEGSSRYISTSDSPPNRWVRVPNCRTSRR